MTTDETPPLTHGVALEPVEQLTDGRGGAGVPLVRMQKAMCDIAA